MLWCSTHPFLYTCSTRCLEDPVKMVNSHISRRFHPTAPFSNVAPDVSQKRRIQSIYRFISAASAYPKCDRRRNEQVIPRGRGNSQKHWEHWWNLGRSLGLINSGLLAWYALIMGKFGALFQECLSAGGARHTPWPLNCTGGQLRTKYAVQFITIN